jgi:hypothetical protein
MPWRCTRANLFVTAELFQVSMVVNAVYTELLLVSMNGVTKKSHISKIKSDVKKILASMCSSRL